LTGRQNERRNITICGSPHTIGEKHALVRFTARNLRCPVAERTLARGTQRAEMGQFSRCRAAARNLWRARRIQSVMGHLPPQRNLPTPPPDRLTRVITAILYFGMLATVAGCLWVGLRALPAL
jgi:hypothetical protein